MKRKSINNKEAEFRSDNDAFRRIKPVLEKLGWRYVEKYATWFEYGDSLNIVFASALKLEKDGTVLAIIPFGDGIEISKVGIPGSWNFTRKFLNNLFLFLIKNGIREIYRPLFDNHYNYPQNDRIDYENRIKKDVREQGFIPLRGPNKARFNVQGFLKQNQRGKFDRKLLSSSFSAWE